MKDDKPGSGQPGPAASIPNRILGSLRDALNAASRDDRSGEITVGQRTEPMPKAAAPDARPRSIPPPSPSPRALASPARSQLSPSSSSAPPMPLREAKAPHRTHFEAGEPTTRAVRGPVGTRKTAAGSPGDGGKTQVIRGKPKGVNAAFLQDPVVGWLVVVAGHGLGAFRPIFEGNNAIGRAKDQRIPIDFGDDTISSEEQAYIRYNSMDRLVPVRAEPCPRPTSSPSTTRSRPARSSWSRWT